MGGLPDNRAPAGGMKYRGSVRARPSVVDLHRTLTSGYRQYPGSAAGQTRQARVREFTATGRASRTGPALVSNSGPYLVGESRIRRVRDGAGSGREQSWTGFFLERG
jgi:hypothetical protein